LCKLLQGFVCRGEPCCHCPTALGHLRIGESSNGLQLRLPAGTCLVHELCLLPKVCLLPTSLHPWLSTFVTHRPAHFLGADLPAATCCDSHHREPGSGKGGNMHVVYKRTSGGYGVLVPRSSA
jgi:hypothetical protein